MATTLESLISQLNEQKPYQPLSEEGIRTRAHNRYQSAYDEKRLNAKQTYENSDAALARELSGLQSRYDQQRASADAQSRSAYSQADRHALSRGMQRSSYNEANLTDIALAGNEAQRGIDREQAEQEKEIGEKRTQLSAQLSQTLSQLNVSQKNDELAYADELTAREHERTAQQSAAKRDLALQLYEYRHELEQEQREQERWQMEFRARYGDVTAASAAGRTTAGPAAQTAASAGAARQNQRLLMV